MGICTHTQHMHVHALHDTTLHNIAWTYHMFTTYPSFSSNSHFLLTYTSGTMAPVEGSTGHPTSTPPSYPGILNSPYLHLWPFY